MVDPIPPEELEAYAQWVRDGEDPEVLARRWVADHPGPFGPVLRQLREAAAQ